MNHKPAIVLAGNPNVGKTTIFNCLTGMRQHTRQLGRKDCGQAPAEYGDTEKAKGKRCCPSLILRAVIP